MSDIRQIDNKRVEIEIDTSIYDDWVIEKVLYWLSSDYIICRQNQPENHKQVIILTLKEGKDKIDFNKLQEKLSDDFIDYKNRQTISRETANIRDLLFAKAFANNDDFVEFTFQD